MKAIDKIRLILGEEDFERFKRYYNRSESIASFCKRHEELSLYYGFTWSCSPEGWSYWDSIDNNVQSLWNTIEDTIIYPRTIGKEEHDEIFRMFVLAYYGFIKIDEYSVTRFFEENSIMDRLYDALRSEE